MIDRKPTLCVVAGPNGSGKTTTTVQLLNNEWTAESQYINPDNIAQEMFGDWNSPEAVMKAAEHATKLRYECLEQKRDFVFETVFSSAEKLEFLRKAKEAGFFIRLFYVCTSDPAINVARITQRYLNGGHEEALSRVKELERENARLRLVLHEHRIAVDDVVTIPRPVPKKILSVEERVELFQSLFKGREDVFARRWQGKENVSTLL